MANNFGFEPDAPTKQAPKIDFKVDFEPDNAQESEDNVLNDAADFVLKQVRGAVSGINQLIPFSDQIISAKRTAQQLLSGDISADQVVDAFNQNTSQSLQAKQTAIREAPVAAGLGMGVGAAGTAVATGGLGPIAQAGTGLAQASGISGGETLAAGGSAEEAIQSAGISGALSAALMGAPQAVKSTKSAVSKLKQRITGLSPEEVLDRSVGGTLRGSSTQVRDLANEKPGIGQTFIEEDLINSGVKGVPNTATPVTKIKKNIDAKLLRRGQEIGNLVENAEPVNKLNILDSLRDKVNELKLSSTNKATYKRLEKVIEDIGSEATDDIIPATNAFKEKQLWDEVAFKSGKVFQPTKAASTEAQTARIVRDAYRNEIKNSIASSQGSGASEMFDFLNKRYSDLSALKTVAQSGEFKKSALASLPDRLTIGAVMTAARSPGIATAFFGGRELQRAIGGRKALSRPSFRRGLTSRPQTVPGITSAFNRPQE